MRNPQELMIVSSIGSIIFHFIRSELLFGNGLPLGLVTSGWSFSQLRYHVNSARSEASFLPDLTL